MIIRDAVKGCVRDHERRISEISIVPVVREMQVRDDRKSVHWCDRECYKRGEGGSDAAGE